MRPKMLIAVCASLAWLLLLWLGSARSVAPTPRAADALQVAVQRRGVQVHSERPAGLLHDITPGDVLTFRITGEPAGWAQLSGFEAGAWITYFHGDLRAGQPAPSVTVMQRGRVSLKLTLCDSAAQKTCEERHYLL